MLTLWRSDCALTPQHQPIRRPGSPSPRFTRPGMTAEYFAQHETEIKNMASLVLGIAGSAIGPSLFGAGFSLFGATISGAQIGGAIGSLIGCEIDRCSCPAERQAHRSAPHRHEHPGFDRRRADPALYGRCAWRASCSGRRSSRRPPPPRDAVAAARAGRRRHRNGYEYPIRSRSRSGYAPAWRRGSAAYGPTATCIDISQFTTRFYAGNETQDADPLIEEIEGDGNTPSYRGVAYIVFEDMPLAQFGNRIPQLQFEIIRAIRRTIRTRWRTC